MAGMYSKPVRKPKQQSAALIKNTPDDVFVAASDDKEGFIAISLKGRIAYVTPQMALNIATQLSSLAESTEQRRIKHERELIYKKAREDRVTKGVYNNDYIPGTDSHTLYDNFWNTIT